jgi:hypothetical protein
MSQQERLRAYLHERFHLSMELKGIVEDADVIVAGKETQRVVENQI